MWSLLKSYMMIWFSLWSAFLPTLAPFWLILRILSDLLAWVFPKIGQAKSTHNLMQITTWSEAYWTALYYIYRTADIIMYDQHHYITYDVDHTISYIIISCKLAREPAASHAGAKVLAPTYMGPCMAPVMGPCMAPVMGPCVNPCMARWSLSKALVTLLDTHCHPLKYDAKKSTFWIKIAIFLLPCLPRLSASPPFGAVLLTSYPAGRS